MRTRDGSQFSFTLFLITEDWRLGVALSRSCSNYSQTVYNFALSRDSLQWRLVLKMCNAAHWIAVTGCSILVTELRTPSVLCSGVGALSEDF
jgi:hypothetical protein